jgi:hypothetical protein
MWTRASAFLHPGSLCVLIRTGLGWDQDRLWIGSRLGGANLAVVMALDSGTYFFLDFAHFHFDILYQAFKVYLLDHPHESVDNHRVELGS